MVSNNKKRPDTWAKRFALNLKTTEDIRQKVEERAKKSGRSITLEVEQQLIKSFEVEEKDALNEEIKAEMRGTIAALEARIASIQEGERMLWPDKSTQLLGKSFAMSIAAVQHAFGTSWRESPAVVDVVTGAIKEVMTKFGRPTSLFASLAIDDRVQPATTAIARSLSDYLDEKMPPLPAPEPTTSKPNRVRMVTTFKDKATGAVLDTFTSPDFDLFDASDRPAPQPNFLAALEKHRPRRGAIDLSTVLVPVEQPDAVLWSDAPPAPEPQPEEPATRLTGQPEATRLMAGTKPARGQDSSVFDEALFAETMGPKRPDDGDDTPPASKPVSAPAKPRSKAKAST